MKAFFGLCVTVFLFSVVFAEFTTKDEEELAKKCAEKFPLSDQDNERAAKDLKFVPPNYKCFINCMYEGMGLIKGGDYEKDTDPFFKYICGLVKEEVGSDKCKDFKQCLSATDTDSCERSFKFAQCVNEKGDKFAEQFASAAPAPSA